MPSRKCPTCHGAKWYDVERERDCGRCLGTGKESNGDKCLKCRGACSEKYKIKEVCSTCHGNGTIKY